MGNSSLLITADSDIRAAVVMVAAEAPTKYVFVAAPPGRFGHARDLKPRLEVTPGRAGRCLLPEQVLDAAGAVVATFLASSMIKGFDRVTLYRHKEGRNMFIFITRGLRDGSFFTIIAVVATIAFGLGTVPASAQTQASVSPTVLVLDQTITKSGFERWAADKCDLRNDPIKDRYRDHPLVGVYLGDWTGGPRANFLIYKVKGDGSNMGNVKVFYANAPFDWGAKQSRGGCWEKHKAKIEPDGSITLAIPRNGSVITLTIDGGILNVQAPLAPFILRDERLRLA